MTLPGKKVLSVFILTAALIATVIIIFGNKKTSAEAKFAKNLTAGEKISLPENPDWESELKQIPIFSTSSGDTAEEETTTDTLSRSLVSNYLALKQNGLLNEQSAQKLIGQAVNLVDKLGNSAISESQLNIIPDRGVETIGYYGDNLGNVFKNNKPSKITNEIEIITVALNQKSAEKMAELDEIIEIYEKTANDLKNTPVPQTFVKAHLNMTNGILAITEALKKIKNSFNDPVIGLQSLGLYQEGVTMFTGAKQATNDFIVKNNIVYKQNTGGYYLLYGI